MFVIAAHASMQESFVHLSEAHSSICIESRYSCNLWLKQGEFTNNSSLTIQTIERDRRVWENSIENQVQQIQVWSTYLDVPSEMDACTYVMNFFGIRWKLQFGDVSQHSLIHLIQHF
jgi:hypothetical protein